MAFRGMIVLLLSSLIVCAQEPAELLEKAPPDVDKALRERISKFYQAHVDGKFRDAYELVADDSKDIFFAAEKTQYRNFTILRIVYSDNFTHAKAVVACGKEFAAFGSRVPLQMPVSSLWKLIDGKWYWYAMPDDGSVETPFGIMHPGPMPQKAPGAIAGPHAPRIVALQGMVKADKSEVHLGGSESSEQVTLSNHLPGVVSLSVDCAPVPGLEIKLDHNELKSKETAVISFRYKPTPTPAPGDLVARIFVMPTSQVIPIRIYISNPKNPQ
jgi:hypothetical protein